MNEQELAELDLAVARAEGWRDVGGDSHCRPLHRLSLDFPGTVIADFNSKGPHPALESPNGGLVYFCGCHNTTEVPRFSTDGAEAMRLLEKYEICLYRKYTGKWVAHRPKGPAIEFGPTPAIAICRAVVALSALEARAEGTPRAGGPLTTAQRAASDEGQSETSVDVGVAGQGSGEA